MARRLGGSQPRKYRYHCGPKPGAALRSAFSQAIEARKGARARQPEATHLDPVLLLLPLLSLVFNLNDFQLQLLLLQRELGLWGNVEVEAVVSREREEQDQSPRLVTHHTVPIRATFHSAVVLSTPELLGSELVAHNPVTHQVPYLRTFAPLELSSLTMSLQGLSLPDPSHLMKGERLLLLPVGLGPLVKERIWTQPNSAQPCPGSGL